MLSAFFLSLVFVTSAWASEDRRIDCAITSDFNFNNIKENCQKFGCVYQQSSVKDVPWCYFDNQKKFYQVKSLQQVASSGLSVDLQLKKNVAGPFKQFDKLKVDVEYLTDRIVRFKVTPPNQKRFEVPIQSEFPLLKNKPNEDKEDKRKYKVQVSDDGKDFDIFIIRKDNGLAIFNTSIGPLYYSDQFLHIASHVVTKNVYGTGENRHPSFRHDFKYKTWPMFTKDELNDDNEKNFYGVHPFYTVIENDGKAHGVFLLNSNAMEFTFLPSPGVSMKTIGGILDVFIFLGDTPDQVIQLYTSLIGRPMMPPYWGLGFHLTRYGYKNTTHVKDVIDRNHAANIPMDVHYLDIDYMDTFKDFTYDKKNFDNITGLMTETRNKLGLKWVLIIDPAINANDSRYEAFMDGMKNDVFIKWPKQVSVADRKNPIGVMIDRDIMYGRVWPFGPSAFPDFFKNQTRIWWKKWLRNVYEEVGMQYDGLWIDMNEPANFVGDEVCPTGKGCYNLECPFSTWDEIPVRFKPVYSYNTKKLSFKTICMTGVQGEQGQFKHYDVHNLYGLSETPPTQEAIQEVTKKRGFVLTRSTYPSSGRYSAHWFGDNLSKWTHLKNSIIQMMEFSLFGISWTGADICGFAGWAQAEMCLVWSLLGAFYPFSRNHNMLWAPAQDPAVWITKGYPEVTAAARNSLNIRYQLLPHLYTLFYRSHVFGETLIRSLAFEFPTDQTALGIDEQFMWGSSMVISPVLRPGQKEVSAYLPKDTWYFANWSNMTFTRLDSTGQLVKLKASNLSAPVHLRGGHIIPLGEARLNTIEHRKAGLKMLVLPKNKSAFGQLFWDDGDSIDTIQKKEYNLFQMELKSNCCLVIDKKENGYRGPPLLLKTVTVCSLDSRESITVTVNGKQSKSVSVVNDQAVLPVEIDLHDDQRRWIIEWKTASNKCNLK